VIRAGLLAVVVVVVTLSIVPWRADADGTGCLSAPLPTTPAPPVFSRNVQRGVEQSHFDVWRQACPGGGSIVLLRVTPITFGPFICDLSFTLVQGASQFDIVLTDQNEPFGFCNNLFVPLTFYVAPDGPAYDPQQVFTLLFDTVTASPRFAAIDVAAAGPLPPSSPTVTVIATACTTCHSGQVVGYDLSINNPGPPMVAEIKGGARFPDGSILPLLNTVTSLPSGPSTLILFPAQALPGGLPTLDLFVEAAILEPTLGLTLSRHSVVLHLLP
jgi:hypothetical protein